MEPKLSASAPNPDMGLLRPHLLRAARRMAARSDAEDFVQEAFARALERRHVLRPGTNLGAWLRPVIRNLAIDEGRKRRKHCPLEDGHACAPSAPSATPAWAMFDALDIRRALDDCPEDFRTAFELHYWDKLTLDVIAARLRVPRATVGTRLYRARAHVKRRLTGELSAAQAQQ